MNDASNRRKRGFNITSKPMPVSKSKAINMFRRSKQKKESKPKQASSHPLHYAELTNNPKAFKVNTPKHRNERIQREKAATFAAKSPLEQLQFNWNNRRPYDNKRKQQKLLRTNLPKTEFKVLLDEHQMAQCYDPLTLYQLNKELMTNNIGTCRVEGIQSCFCHFL